MLESLEATMQLVTGQAEPLQHSLVLGDTGFFTEQNLQEAEERAIEVLIPDPQFRQRDPYFAEKKAEKVPKQPKKYTREDFKYAEKEDAYICPAGERLECKGTVALRNNSGKKYQAKSGSCGMCPLKDRCITMKKKTSDKPVRTLYIADQKHAENLSAKMRETIDEPANRELYSRRMQIIEPVFANIKHCKGMNRFMLRGEEKVNNQWQLYCIVHNIGKCVKPTEAQHRLKHAGEGKMGIKEAV